MPSKHLGKIAPHGEAIQRVRPQEPEHDAAVTVSLEDARAGRTTVQRYQMAPSYASANWAKRKPSIFDMRPAAHGSVSRISQRLVVEQKVAASAGFL